MRSIFIVLALLFVYPIQPAAAKASHDQRVLLRKDFKKFKRIPNQSASYDRVALHVIRLIKLDSRRGPLYYKIGLTKLYFPQDPSELARLQSKMSYLATIVTSIMKRAGIQIPFYGPKPAS